MMKITILLTGKCKDKSILSLEAEYLKRLKPFFKVSVIELPQAKGNTPEEIKAKEAQAQRQKIPKDACIIALDERGQGPSTSQIAEKFNTWQGQGVKDLVLIIGGAEGLDATLRNQADYVWSLSKLTFPHMLVRVILTEQVYRIATYLAGHPYHREG